MLKPMFRKHVLLTMTVFAIVGAICFFLSQFIETYERNRFFNEQASALINQIQAHPGDKESFVQELNEANHKMHLPLTVEILSDQSARDPRGLSLTTMVQTASGEKSLRVSMRHFGPPLGRPPGAPPRGGPFMGPGPGMFGPPLVMFGGMVVVILLASALSVLLIYRSFREKAEIAREVLGRMQRGDLKARFEISKRDEAHQMFELFNQMASEIERLVERLREDERTRVGLLQELAHDLRTPVSSIKNAIETIRFDEEKLKAVTKAEIKEMAFQETEYLSRLVDDLLFLALVLEPKYKSESAEVSLSDLVQSQILAATSNHPNVRPVFNANAGDVHITGNPHQLRRMLRNAFENAFSFARSTVTISLNQSVNGIEVRIQDDGPGLASEALAAFGKKKSFTRYRTLTAGGRPSIGLGSVILKTIAGAHGGDARIANVFNEDGQPTGATLTITLAARLQNAA